MNRKYVIAILQIPKEGGDIDGLRVGTLVDVAIGSVVPNGQVRCVAVGNLTTVEIGHESVVVAKGQ